jgi:hypothetical protein
MNLRKNRILLPGNAAENAYCSINYIFKNYFFVFFNIYFEFFENTQIHILNIILSHQKENNNNL